MDYYTTSRELQTANFMHIRGCFALIVAHQCSVLVPDVSPSTMACVHVCIKVDIIW